MVYEDSEKTKAIQPIFIKSSGSPLYSMVCDLDSSSSPTVARNMRYDGKTLKAVFNVPAVKFVNNVPTTSSEYGIIDHTSSSQKNFFCTRSSASLLRSFNGGLTGFATDSCRNRSGAYIKPWGIKNNSGSTWYVVVAALLPDGEGSSQTLQMGVYTGLSDITANPGTPTRIQFNQQVSGFPCRTASYKFTCYSGNGFLLPGVNYANPSNTWFGNCMIGIST